MEKEAWSATGVVFIQVSPDLNCTRSWKYCWKQTEDGCGQMLLMLLGYVSCNNIKIVEETLYVFVAFFPC